MNDDVFLSILSMDVYNRGGVRLDLTGASLGSATLIGDPSVNETTGFFAQVYLWGDESVISFRGTDVRGPEEEFVRDAVYGWSNGAANDRFRRR